MPSGVVFSIEEFSLYDGPGIRTTVFFKGCPMRCTWCHSPEGQSPVPEPIRSPNGCIGCNACLMRGKELTGEYRIVAESAEVCPRRLIREAGKIMQAETLVEKILKNRDVFASTGGGVTFSGGEPTAQPEFLLACLRLLRRQTNRAIQTCGYCDPSVFARILAECDYVLYDLKLINSEMHQHFCGRDNAVILENYHYLAASGVPFITRIPVIPRVNDTVENMEATARLMREVGAKRLELLPYHKLSGAKYAMTGRIYAPGFDETVAPQMHTELFESLGIEVNIL